MIGHMFHKPQWTRPLIARAVVVVVIGGVVRVEEPVVSLNAVDGGHAPVNRL